MHVNDNLIGKKCIKKKLKDKKTDGSENYIFIFSNFFWRFNILNYILESNFYEIIQTLFTQAFIF